MEWWEKLFELRYDLSLKQGEFAKLIGITQKDLSLVEKGKKRFVPELIIRYLLKNDYDLNSFFDEHSSLVKIEDSDYRIDYKDALVREAGVEYNTYAPTTATEIKILDEVISNFHAYKQFRKFDELKAMILDGENDPLSVTQRLERLEAVASAMVLKNGLFSEEDENESKD